MIDEEWRDEEVHDEATSPGEGVEREEKAKWNVAVMTSSAPASLFFWPWHLMDR